MQRVIQEITQSQAKNSHMDFLKKELESKNQTISNLESKIFNSCVDQSFDQPSEYVEGRKKGLK